MSDPIRQRVLEVLSAPTSPLREQGVRLFVDHALGHKLRDAVDLQDIHALVLTALTRENLERIITQHVQPGWQRYSEHAPDSDTLVGELVPPEARAKLIMLAEQLRLPRAKWVQGCVDPALVRQLLGPVWVQVLLNFTKRFPVPGLGTAPAAIAGGRGLAGMLGRSVQQQAGRFVDAGRSVMEGLGIDVEKKLLIAARDFSDSALSVWSEAMRERLASDEGWKLLAQINTSVVDHILRTEFRDLQLDAAELPIERVHELLPELVAHAARSKFVLDIVQRELAAYLALEGDRSVGELLGQLGVLDEARALLVAKGDDLMRTLSESAAFSDWLARLLDA
jgi:hypothetical protein